MENSMLLPNIRIRKITLTNFRNIVHAEVDLPGGKQTDYVGGTASVLGVYGQNGSGKTSLLMAINALKEALRGGEFLYPEYSSCIRFGSDYARLEFDFSAYNEHGDTYDIHYGFSISVYDSDSEHDSDAREEYFDEETMELIGLGKVLTQSGRDKINEFFKPQDKRIRIFDEILKFSGTSAEGKKINKQVLIDTSDNACKNSGKAFGNKKKYDQLTANCDSSVDELLYKCKVEASIKSRSFIFSSRVVKTLIRGSEVTSHKIILKALSEYGDNYLYVILTMETAVNNMRMLPLYLWLNEEAGASGMLFPIKLFENSQMPEEIYPYILKAIDSVSKVISSIVPGLTVEINDIGKTVSEKGLETHVFDLISNRNGVRIPLAYESDGIRRIISFLSLLVAVYNNPSVTIAVDELDSGIFEYMLGELISIIRESGKGQFIFTSHNLRPLEVLPNRNLLFTTINSGNRFSKLDGISGNNNLRDSYFRSITLGGGENALYDSTDSYTIEQALYEAGQMKED